MQCAQQQPIFLRGMIYYGKIEGSFYDIIWKEINILGLILC